MKQMLYTASLERHMDTYFQGVRLDDYNQQYQLAQMRIVREGELMQLSQAEIQYKLAQLKTAMETNLKQTVLPKLIMDRTANTVNNIVENIAPVAVERPRSYRDQRPQPPIFTDLPVTPMSTRSVSTNAPTPGTPPLESAPRTPYVFKTSIQTKTRSAPQSRASTPIASKPRSAPSTPMYTTKRPPAIIVEEETKRSPPRSRAATPGSNTSSLGTSAMFGSPSSSEAPTESTSTTAQPSSPPKDKKLTPINFKREKKFVTAMIKGLRLNQKISAETAYELLTKVGEIKDTGATKRLNTFSSELMSKYDLDTGSEAFRDKRKEIYAALDAFSRDKKQRGQDVGPLLAIQKATSMEDLNAIIKRHHINVLQGSGLKSKRKVSKC